MAIGNVMLAADLLPSLYTMGVGIDQSIKGRKLAKKTQRPKYQIPQAYKDLLNQTKMMAGASGLPGQSQMDAKRMRETAGAIEGVQQSGQSAASQLGTISAIQGNNNRSIENQTMQGAQYRNSQLGQLYKAEQFMAEEQKAQNQMDIYDPYYEAMAAASAMQAGARKNMKTALSGLATSTVSGLKFGAENPGLFEGKSGKETWAQRAYDRSAEERQDRLDANYTGTPAAASGGHWLGNAASAPPPSSLPGFDPSKNPYYKAPIGAANKLEEMLTGVTFDDQIPEPITSALAETYYGMSPEVARNYGMGSSISRILTRLFHRNRNNWTEDL